MLKNEACERLTDVISHIRIAIEMAKLEIPDGSVHLAVLAKKLEGGGRITAYFDGERFIADIALLLEMYKSMDTKSDLELNKKCGE